MKNSLTYLFIAFLFLANSCSKDDNNENLSGNSSTVKTTIIGRVFDESGIALVGADVYIGNKIASTNLWGIYLIEDAQVSKDRSLVTVKKAGYWDQVGTFRPMAGGTSSSDLCMYSSTNTHTVDAIVGGTIATTDGASIQFPVDAFEKMDGTSYTGTVALTVHHLPRSANQFGLKVPGTDFKGKTINNAITNLISFGMIGATLKDGSGNELRLKSGKKATISLPVHSAQIAIATPSIPLWHFNDVTAIWEEEGTALFNGSNYTGEVSHFSWWNCDLSNAVIVSGKVLDCMNHPVQNATIVIDPGLMGPSTNINGEWFGAITSNLSQVLHAEWIDWSNSQIFSSLDYTVPPTAPASTVTLPNFYIQSPNCYSVFGDVYKCTGQPSFATVLVIQNNELIGYQFTTTGKFEIQVGDLGNVPVDIITYLGLYSTTLSTNFIAGTSLNVGALYLCDTVNLNNNVIMTFSTPSLGNIPFSLDVTSCNVNFLSGKYEMTMAYTDSASGNSSSFVITTPLYANGIYNWNTSNIGISGSIFYQGILYNILQNPPGGSTSLSNTPASGGYVRGTFNGPVILSGGLVNISGTLTSNFDIYRNN